MTNDTRDQVTSNETKIETKPLPFFAKKVDGSGLVVRTSIRAGAGGRTEQLVK